MRVLSRLNKNKRGVSVIVSYVLLISISVALSALVYNWLRFYVGEDEVPECSSDISLIIQDYFCLKASSTPGSIEVTLKNKGLFTVDGYSLRVHDDPDAEFGFYTFDRNGSTIPPGEVHTQTYPLNASDGTVLSDITLIEIQPFVMEGNKVSCRSHSFQKIVCE